jgi:hypothetical protein
MATDGMYFAQAALSAHAAREMTLEAGRRNAQVHRMTRTVTDDGCAGRFAHLSPSTRRTASEGGLWVKRENGGVARPT